jgi:hypothetical protein
VNLTLTAFLIEIGKDSNAITKICQHSEKQHYGFFGASNKVKKVPH